MAPGLAQAVVVSGIATGIVVYGMTAVVRLVRMMDDARTDIANRAVAAERTRFARDLHDQLGHDISAIALKSEIAHKLVRDNPSAEEELAQITAISRRALTEMRSVASGYRELSLRETVTAVRSLLAAADVDVHLAVELDDTSLAPSVGTVLATVLREGVTNVLRHSSADRCDVTIRRVDRCAELVITNDGVGGNAADRGTAARGGAGVRNLSERVAELGGTFAAGPGADGCYRLRVTVPLRAGRLVDPVARTDLVTASRRSVPSGLLRRGSELPAS